MYSVGMRAILIYYLKHSFNYSDADAMDLSSGFTSTSLAVYFLGSIVADKIIGNKAAVLLGTVAMMLGHIFMALGDGDIFLYGLSSLVYGLMFFSVPIISLIGDCYKKGDPKGTSAFTITYMVFNVGSLLASLTVGPVARTWGWHYGFGLAAIIMILGGIFYFIVLPKFKHMGNPKRKVKGIYFIILFSYPILLYIISLIIKHSDIRKILYIIMCIAAAGVFLYLSIKGDMKQRISLMKIAFVLFSSIFVVAIMDQSDYAVALFAERNVDRLVSIDLFGYKGAFEIAPSALMVIDPIVVIVFGIFVNRMWRYLTKNNIHLSYIQKTLLSPIIIMLGFLLLYLITFYPNEEAKVHYSLYLFVILVSTCAQFFYQPICFAVTTEEAPKGYKNTMIVIYRLSMGISAIIAAEISKIMDIGEDVTNAFTSLEIYSNGFKRITYWGWGATFFIVFFGIILDRFIKKKEAKL